MRLAWISDVHLGNHRVHGGAFVAGLNERCRLVLGALRAAYDIATKEDCQAMIINGDLFDTAKPPPQLIAAAQEVIGHYPDIPTFIMLGNHDMESAAEGDHALGPLRPVARIIEKPEKIYIRGKDKEDAKGRQSVDAVDVWAVPFRPGPAAEWLPAVLAEVQGLPSTGSPASSARVLALHLGLSDGKTPPWLQGAHDSISVELVQELMKKHELDACYMGNWHDPKELTFHDVDRSVTQPLRIVQIGTTCPTGFDNPGLDYGTMAIYDSLKERNCRTVRVPGPRFVTTEEEALKAPKGCKVFLRLKASSEDVPNAQAKLDALRKAGIEGEVIPDTAETQVALRTAAGVARSATTVDEAVAGFVDQMPLEAGLERAEVLARVKEFLGGAA